MSALIPCSERGSDDPGSADTDCMDEATYVDSKGRAWCAAHGPSSTVVKGQARASIKQSELNRLVQQLVDLREALRPFAVFGSCLPVIDPAVQRITDDGVILNVYKDQVNYNITCTDLRKALALMEKLKLEDYERLVHVTEQRMLGSPQEQLEVLQKEVEVLKEKELEKMKVEWEAEYAGRKAQATSGGSGVRAADGAEATRTRQGEG